jgi:hypothetical protein
MEALKKIFIVVIQHCRASTEALNAQTLKRELTKWNRKHSHLQVPVCRSRLVFGPGHRLLHLGWSGYL